MNFKSLRKTYLSYLHKEVGDQMIELCSHSDIKVVKEHYLDKELTTKGGNIKIFK